MSRFALSREREWVAVAVVVGAVLALNLLTGSRSPIPWQDEVQLNDPIVHLLAGEGLVTWTTPRPPEMTRAVVLGIAHTWVGAAWMSIFGTGILATRSSAYFLMSGAAVALWAGVRRIGLVTSPLLRVALVAVFLCGFGIARTYRSGRYDIEGIAIIAIAVLVASIERAWVRRAGLVLVGLVAPFCALPLLAYGGIVGALSFAFFGRRVFADLAALGGGMALGFGAFHGLHALLGTRGELTEFLAIVGTGSSLGTRLVHLRNALPGVLLTDPSTVALVVAAGGAAFLGRRHRGARPAIFAAAAFVAVPCGMALAGKYPSYYTWMAFLPVLVGTLVQVDRLPPTTPRAGRTVVALLLAVAGAGLFVRVAVTALQWEARDPARAVAFAAEQVRGDDVVLADFSAYYAVRGRAARELYVKHVPQMDDAARAAVSVIVAPPPVAARLAEEIGGEWREAGRLPPAAPALFFYEEQGRTGRQQGLARIRLAAGAVYDLTALRRVP